MPIKKRKIKDVLYFNEKTEKIKKPTKVLKP